MSRFASLLALAALAVVAASSAGQDAPVKLKAATIQWVADAPLLTYDVRYLGGDTTTMPTALKYLLKDLAECEGWYLTGEDKSKTIASQAKRISLEYTKARSKLKTNRVGKIEAKETPGAVEFVVTFAKKPGGEELTRLGGVLETFARKYVKAAKSISAAVQHEATTKANVWNFEVRFKEPAAKKK